MHYHDNADDYDDCNRSIVLSSWVVKFVMHSYSILVLRVTRSCLILFPTATAFDAIVCVFPFFVLRCIFSLLFSVLF